MVRHRLGDAVRAALADPAASLADALLPWDGRELTLADAEDLVAVLAEQDDARPLVDAGRAGAYATPLGDLALLFQSDSTDDATRHLRKRGMPELARLFDAALEEPAPPAHPLLVVAKMFALYTDAPGVGRIAAAARRFPDEYALSTVFGLLADERHPHGPAVVDRLRDPLPDGFAAVAFVDLANALARRGRLPAHPFDTPAGVARLEAWLTDPDPGRHSYAVSATAALPFVALPAREQLLGLAMDHESTAVQIEGAWASAFRGGTAGVKVLGRLCLDPRFAVTARGYLTELNRADAVPPAADDPALVATAEMCRWLSHPNEFGDPPTDVDVLDTRELDWPPTDDRRRLWLVRFRYAGRAEDVADEVGVGLVGSVTFALAGETGPHLSPEDVYGLHCCWELQMRDDPRAPAERSAAAGRALLGI